MEYASRKRRKELKSAQDKSIAAQKLSDEELFKEQKKRLRRQLNSASSFALDANDLRVSPHALQTRTEVKKQKKIDDILRDIAVLPENEYLNEDTNLRLLKKMSVAKQYNRLQLSPEQEEKMAENKEKFETITNQLWFLISELEKGKAPEPEIGTVPKIVSEEVIRNRNFFDVETAKTAEHKYKTYANQDFEMTNINTKIDLLEEKLEKISLKNDELEDVLQDLEKVVQEGKTIVNDEVHLQEYDIGEAPDDTLELLVYLEKVEQLNQTKAMKLDETRQGLIQSTPEQPRLGTLQERRGTGERPLIEKGISSAKQDNDNMLAEVAAHTRDETMHHPVKETGMNTSKAFAKKPLPSYDPVSDEEARKNATLQKSIIVLSVIFVILLAILIFMIYNYLA